MVLPRKTRKNLQQLTPEKVRVFFDELAGIEPGDSPEIRRTKGLEWANRVKAEEQAQRTEALSRSAASTYGSPVSARRPTTGGGIDDGFGARGLT